MDLLDYVKNKEDFDVDAEGFLKLLEVAWYCRHNLFVLINFHRSLASVLILTKKQYVLLLKRATAGGTASGSLTTEPLQHGEESGHFGSLSRRKTTLSEVCLN